MDVILHDAMVENLARARLAIAPPAGRTMFDADVLSLCSGEGLCRPHPAAVARAMIALLDTKGSTLENYRYLCRHEILEGQIYEFMAESGLSGCHSEEALLTDGVTRVIESFIVSHTDPGDVSFISCNHYHPLPKLFEILGRKVVLVSECDTRNDGCISGKSLKASIDYVKAVYGKRAKLGALFLFNPGYTGELYDPQTLSSIAEVLVEYRMPVFEDAIFTGLEFAQSARRVASHLPPEHVVVTGCGVSKLFGLANARVGWAMGSRSSIAPMTEFTLGTNPGNFWVALEASRGALASRATYLPACREELTRRANLIERLCSELNAECGKFDIETVVRPVRKPLAGHSILLDFSALAQRLELTGIWDGGFQLTKRLLQECGVAFSPAGSHGHPNSIYLRVCHASVGAAHTYAESAETERMIVAPVMHALALGDHVAAVNRAKTIETEPFRIPESGWAAGRELIEIAFLKRLLPWIRQQLTVERL